MSILLIATVTKSVPLTSKASFMISKLSYFPVPRTSFDLNLNGPTSSIYPPGAAFTSSKISPSSRSIESLS